MSDVAQQSSGMFFCRKCDRHLNAESFYVDRRRGRLAMPCRDCTASYYKNRTTEQRQKAIANTAAWRAGNAARAKETSRQWWIANGEAARARSAEWRAANPNKMKAARDNWRNANRAKANLLVAQWQKRNLEAHKAKENRRRARKRNSGGSYTPADIADIAKRQRFKCAVCQEQLKPNRHIDHIMPLALGGSNARRNIQLLCPPCNLRKSAKHPIDFMRQLGNLL